MIPVHDSWLQLYERRDEDQRGRDFTGRFIWFSCFVLWCCEDSTSWFCFHRHFCLLRRIWGTTYPVLSGTTFVDQSMHMMKDKTFFLENLIKDFDFIVTFVLGTLGLIVCFLFSSETFILEWIFIGKRRPRIRGIKKNWWTRPSWIGSVCSVQCKNRSNSIPVQNFSYLSGTDFRNFFTILVHL